MIAYKICFRDDIGRFFSWTSIGELKLEYKIGEVVEAIPALLEVGLGIFCFKTLDDAIAYDACLDTSRHIFKCEVEPLFLQSNYIILGYYTVKEVLEHLYNKTLVSYVGNNIIMAKTCRLLEEIKFNKKENDEEET